jgi:hypothetical protein
MDQFIGELIESDIPKERKDIAFYLIGKDKQLYQIYRNDAIDNNVMFGKHWFHEIDGTSDLIGKKECYITTPSFHDILQEIINGLIQPDVFDNPVQLYHNGNSINHAITYLTDIINNDNVIIDNTFKCSCRLNVIADIIRGYYKGSFVPVYLSRSRYTHGYISHIDRRQISLTIGVEPLRQIRVAFIIGRGEHTKSARTF